MLIGGYRSMSLIDYPGCVSAVVFLRGCDFMCPYCHNPELIPLKGETVSEDEFFSVVSGSRRMIDGVCVTGGEPCLQPGLPEFLARIKDIGLKVKLDTNGSEPEMLSFILSGGFVDYVAMDIKHSFEKYGEVVKRHDWREVSGLVSRSMEIIRSAGVDYEYRTTVWKGVHAKEDISDIASLMKEGEKYFLQDLRVKKTLIPIDDKDGIRAGEIIAAIAEKHPGIIMSVRS